MTRPEPSPQDQLTQLKALLHQREQELDAARTRLGFIDERFPVYLAYIDTKECYRYHNRAYREWLGLEAGKIDGHTMREVLGEFVYAEIAKPLRDALGGRRQRYERTQKAANGGVARYFIQLIPDLDDMGSIHGIYALVIDETESLPSFSFDMMNVEVPAANGKVEPDVEVLDMDFCETFQTLYDDSLVSELGEHGEWKNAADRIKSAIQNDEFHLYGQTIKAINDDDLTLCEIYMRMTEEEENLMPPGSFLPLAEQHGLMPEIDRWVVTNVLKLVAARRQANPNCRMIGYTVNLALDTIRDPYFSDFVRAKLALFDVPGEALYFEIEEGDVSVAPQDAAHIVQELARLGCMSILCGFGRDKVSFTILKELRVAYIKIDGGIILQILRDKSALAKLVSINRAAHAIGIKTIAEYVESDEIFEKLEEIEVDFVQGIGISSPVPLAQIE